MSRLPTTISIGNRTVPVPVTLIDRLVNWRDPVKGAERYQARARMAIIGGYHAADRTRTANQKGYKRERDAATLIASDSPALRAESQDMVRNSPIGGGAIALNVTKVVGRGLQPKAQLDRDVLNLSDDQADAWERAAEREWRLATETREIDAERCLPFSLLQGLAFLKVLEDGDILVNLPRFFRPGSPYRLKIELIEAARISNRDHKPDTTRTVAGVTVDNYGAPETYTVSDRHPGNLRAYQQRAAMSWIDLKAFGRSGQPLALLLLDKKRPGQPRGVPYLAPVIELIKQLGRYTDAEVMAAVINGMLTAFVYSDSGSPEFSEEDPLEDASSYTDSNDEVSRMTLGNGSVLGLPPGKRVEVVDGTRPNINFDPFVMALLRQIGMALELPFEVLVKHFTSSYSAARGALEEAWDYFNRRRHWLATQFCQPIYEAVLTEAVATGRLAAPGFFADPLIRRAWLATLWQGDAPSTLDPVKEITAAEKRIALRLTTRSEERARLIGGDWENSVPQMRREEQLLKEADLLPEMVTEPVAAAPDAPAAPEPIDPEEENADAAA
jgi:lambda family phage portal protein